MSVACPLLRYDAAVVLGRWCTDEETLNQTTLDQRYGKMMGTSEGRAFLKRYDEEVIKTLEARFLVIDHQDIYQALTDAMNTLDVKAPGEIQDILMHFVEEILANVGKVQTYAQIADTFTRAFMVSWRSTRCARHLGGQSATQARTNARTHAR